MTILKYLAFVSQIELTARHGEDEAEEIKAETGDPNYLTDSTMIGNFRSSKT